MVFTTHIRGSCYAAAWDVGRGSFTLLDSARLALEVNRVGTPGTLVRWGRNADRASAQRVVDDLAVMLGIGITYCGPSGASAARAPSPRLESWRCERCQRRAETERRWIGIALGMSANRLAKAIAALPPGPRQTRTELEAATTEIRELSTSLLWLNSEPADPDQPDLQ